MSESTGIARLVDALTRRTRSGRIEWKRVGESVTRFTYTSSTGTISIESRDGDGIAPFEFSVYNQEGVLIGRESEETPEGPLKDLYEAVDERSIGRKATLEQLIREVEDEEDQGPLSGK